VDYDVDVIVRSNMNYKVVDEHEFVENKQKYYYPQAISRRVELTVRQLIAWIRQGHEPFTKSFSAHWYHQYLSLGIAGVNGRCNP
jgi:protein associated with RNAse G/E